jgi:biofilm PGA synthesis N-glycosyltransferase PgaC
MNRPRYVIVSPVKDEDRYIERTLMSVRRQTLLPALWLIVDDGSRDETPQILERHAREVDWIRIVRLVGQSGRQPGSGVMRAFLAGLEALQHQSYDFIVKLDCDLEFEPDYFDRLIARFEADATLGIASGMYYEQQGNEWMPVVMPSYHAAGASKVIRRQCFEQIGAFIPSRGWDTVDEIRAQVAGWRTAHFRDLKLLHLKPEGSGIGYLRTNVMGGEIYYLTGGGFSFFLLKCLHRMFAGRPPLLAGLAMLYGYLRCLIGRRARLVTADQARHYRHLLNSRLIFALSQVSERFRVARRSGL